MILDSYKHEREQFSYYMNNLPELEAKLEAGEEKAREEAGEILAIVRKNLALDKSTISSLG